MTTLPSWSGRATARTPRLPTIWGSPPACGSPSCARAAGKPHPATRCNPSPAAGHERCPGTEAPSPAPGPGQPVRRLPSVLVSRRRDRHGSNRSRTCRHHRGLIGQRCRGTGIDPARPPVPPMDPAVWSPSASPHWALVCIPALDDPAAVERDHHAARQLTQTSLHALASRAASHPGRPLAAASRQRLRGALRAAASCAQQPEHDSGPHDAGAQRNSTERTRSMKPVLHCRQAGGRR